MPVHLSSPAGAQSRKRSGGREQQAQRFPANVGHLADGLHGVFRRTEVDNGLGSRILEQGDLRRDRGVGQLEALPLDDDALGSLAETLLQPGARLLEADGILHQNSDLRIRLMIEDVLGVNATFGPERGQERYAPGKMLWVVKPAGASAEEEFLRQPVPRRRSAVPRVPELKLAAIVRKSRRGAATVAHTFARLATMEHVRSPVDPMAPPVSQIVNGRQARRRRKRCRSQPAALLKISEFRLSSFFIPIWLEPPRAQFPNGTHLIYRDKSRDCFASP